MRQLSVVVNWLAIFLSPALPTFTFFAFESRKGENVVALTRWRSKFSFSSEGEQNILHAESCRRLFFHPRNFVNFSPQLF